MNMRMMSFCQFLKSFEEPCQGWTQRGCLQRGGGALEDTGLKRAAQAVSGGEYERG